MNDFQKKRLLLKKQLDEDLKRLRTALDTLKYSLDKCKTLPLNEQLDPESLESLEALTSRFARTSDIVTQKVLKTIFLLLQERPGSFIDLTNRAEKLEIIPDAFQLQTIRELRNEIAHEYRVQDMEELYTDVLGHGKILIDQIRNIDQYARTHNLLPEK